MEQAEYIRRLAEDWAEACIKAGYVTTVQSPEYRKFVAALEEAVAVKKQKYVILRSIEPSWTGHHNQFITMSSDGDETQLADGTVAYEVVGYAPTLKVAQVMCFGYSSTELDD